MQVLLTPSNFNRHKRSRSESDVESNYFKKRLIFVSTSPTPPNTVSPEPVQPEPAEEEENSKINKKVRFEKNNVFTPTSVEAAQQGRLILYTPNTYPLSPPSSPTRKDEYEPMELD